MTPPEAEILGAIRQVIAVFRRLEVEYFVAGSVASTIFGEPRLTIDADVVARLHAHHARPLVESLGERFYADLGAVEAAIARQGTFNLIHLDTMVKIDVHVASFDPFVRSEFARRITRDIGRPEEPLTLDLATPEDVVLAKLEWLRKGGEVSDRQWRDVLGVLKVQAERLDRAYLREWATRLGLEALLGRALEAAGLKTGE